VDEAIDRLADYRQGSARAVLDELLLPRADQLQLEVAEPTGARVGLPLDYTLDLLGGRRKALLAVANSVLDPRPEHARLDRKAAERLVAACQVLPANHPSFALTLACPLDAVPWQGAFGSASNAGAVKTAFGRPATPVCP
jgi:hypothetical protein